MNPVLLQEHIDQLQVQAAALRARRRELNRMLKVNPSIPVHNELTTVQASLVQVRIALDWFWNERMVAWFSA